MVQKPDTARILNELVHRSAAARITLHAAAAHLRERADVPTRVRDSLRSHPLGWVGGSAVIGLLGSLLLRGSRKPKQVEIENPVRRHPLLALGSLAMVAVKPLATRWLTSQLSSKLAAWQDRRAQY